MFIEVRDDEGRVAYPFGRDATGFITYSPDGHMAVQFGRTERASLATSDWLAAAPAEIAAAARDDFAYCGSWELRGGEVVHRVRLSLMPNWIGSEQVRLVNVEGERLTLSTPPLPVGDRQQTAILVWERA